MNVKRQEECLAAGLRYARYKFGLPRCEAKSESRYETFSALLESLQSEVKELRKFLYLHIETKSVYRSDRDKYDNLEKICCECGDVINFASMIVDKIDAQMELGNAVT